MLKSVIGIVCCFVLLVACETKEQKENSQKDKYEKSKLSIEEIEKQSPLRFLKVTGSEKKTLWGKRWLKEN